jgi:c(7)-type cytochrome triheme protein
VAGKVSMDDMSRGKSCGVCHNGKDAFASAGDCDKCHKGMKPGKITFKTSGGEAVFSHEFHLQAYKCPDCHTKIFPYKAGKLKASMADMEGGKSCGACHNKGKDAFSVQDECGKCHKM